MFEGDLNRSPISCRPLMPGLTCGARREGVPAGRRVLHPGCGSGRRVLPVSIAVMNWVRAHSPTSGNEWPVSLADRPNVRVVVSGGDSSSGSKPSSS